MGLIRQARLDKGPLSSAAISRQVCRPFFARIVQEDVGAETSQRSGGAGAASGQGLAARVCRILVLCA
jgi:hypothetical protein